MEGTTILGKSRRGTEVGTGLADSRNREKAQWLEHSFIPQYLIRPFGVPDIGEKGTRASVPCHAVPCKRQRLARE